MVAMPVYFSSMLTSLHSPDQHNSLDCATVLNALVCNDEAVVVLQD